MGGPDYQDVFVFVGVALQCLHEPAEDVCCPAIAVYCSDFQGLVRLQPCQLLVTASACQADLVINTMQIVWHVLDKIEPVVTDIVCLLCCAVFHGFRPTEATILHCII